MAYKVFVSHSAQPEDTALIDLVLQRTALKNIQCYMAQHDVQAGTSLSDKLKAEIQSSNCILVFVTKRSIQSDWVKWEVGIADALKKLIVPVLEKDLSPPAFLVGKEYISFDPEDSSKTADSVGHYLDNLRLGHEKQQTVGWLILAFLGILALAAKE